MVNEWFRKAYPPFYPKPSTLYNSHSLSIMQKSLAPSREGTALSPPTPGSCSTSSTITAARVQQAFLPEHFLSTGFLGSLKLFHFHVFDLAFLCRSIKSQKKPSKPPQTPLLASSHTRKEVCASYVFTTIVFSSISQEDLRQKCLRAVTKYFQSLYHLFKLILLSQRLNKIMHIIYPLFHGTVLLTQWH